MNDVFSQCKQFALIISGHQLKNKHLMFVKQNAFAETYFHSTATALDVLCNYI